MQKQADALRLEMVFNLSARKAKCKKEIEDLEYWCSSRSLHLLEQLDSMAKVLELKGYISVKEGPSVRHMVEDRQQKLKDLQENL